MSINVESQNLQLSKRNSGFTLVELMIAMVISLFLLAGVVQIYSSNRESYRTSDVMSRLQESSRYVGETLSRELRMANHAGCKFFPSKDEDGVPGADGIENIVNIVSTDVSHVLWDIGDTNFKVYPGSSISGSDLGSILSAASYDANSDVLFVRKMSENTNVLKEDYDHADSAKNSYLELLSDEASFYKNGRLYLINDCDSKVSLFQTQNISSNKMYISTGDAEAPNNFSPGNDGVALKDNFPKGSEIGELESSIIFLRTVDIDGDQQVDTREIAKMVLTYDSYGAPKKSDVQVLVRGVESLRFVFGMDTDQDGSADTFKTTANMVDDDWLKVAVARATYTVSTESELNSGIDYSNSEGASEGNLWGALSGVSNADDFDGKVVRRFTKLIDLRNPPRF